MLFRSLFDQRQASAYPYLADNLVKMPSTDFLVKPLSVKPRNKVWKYDLEDGLSIEAINVIHGEIPAVSWRVNSKNCSVVFSGDFNGSSGNLSKLVNDSNLLIVNNAIPQNAGNVAKNLHITPLDIGKLAKDAGVKKLGLSHFMNRTINRKDETIELIRQSYNGEIILAEDLMIIGVE